MKVSQARSGWQGFVFGLFFASLGFSYALATSPRSVAGRGITTGTTRPPTVFFTSSDLGAVVVGSMFTRQVLAQYGFKPHLFSFGALTPTSSLTISDSGTISGVKADTGTEIFTVQVADGFGGYNATIKSQNFTLEAIPAQLLPDLALQFAVSLPGGTLALLPALAHEPYSYTMQGNGGKPPYTFRFASDNDFAALPPGLALDQTSGVILGNPVTPTPTGIPAAFTIILEDANQTQVRQTFSLAVVANTISSNFIATSGGFKLNFGKEGGRDSLSLMIVLDKADLANSGVRKAADLANLPFAMHFGGVSLPPPASNHPAAFDKTGAIRFPNIIGGFMPATGEMLAYTIKLNPATGVLTANFNNIDMIAGLGANMSTFKNPVIPVNIQIGQTAQTTGTSTSTSAYTRTGTGTSTLTVNYDKTDVIKFKYRRSVATGSGQAKPDISLAPGGLFLLAKVQGVEQAGAASDTTSDELVFKLSGYLRQPGGAAVLPNATDNVTVFLGTACLGQFPASSFTNTGAMLAFVNTDSSVPLKSIVIDNHKGAFEITTFPVKARALFGVDALIAGLPYSIPLTLTIATPGAATATFDGQSGVALFRKGNNLRNK